MNLQHLKYALEIEKTKSINKAAENLFMGQPNLSRAIKELEESLGVKIFIRTSRGMTPTPEGQEFLKYAKKIVHEINQVENMFSENQIHTNRFSISVPRGSYISAAFTEFCKKIDNERHAEYIYDETNNYTTLNNITENNFNLGIIRYQNIFEEQFLSMLKRKGLTGELIMEFSYFILVSNKSPLSNKDEIVMDELAQMTEIAHSDSFVPSLQTNDVLRLEINERVTKRIFVYERGSQLDLLSNIPNTYMRVSPMPKRILDAYKLKQLKCVDDGRRYKDMLIYRNNYQLSNLDKDFIHELEKVKDILEFCC